MLDLIRQNEKKIQLAFKISYLVLAISTFNSFLFTSPLQSFFVKICLGLGIIAIISRGLVMKQYLKTAYWKYLLCFMASYLISSLLNAKYGLVDNLKWLVWMGLCFGLLYMYDSERKVSEYKKEFSLVSHILMIYSLLASLISLWMLLARYANFLYLSDGTVVKAGYFWGRLWGVYTDPNYGAVYSVAVIVLTLYFCKVAKNLYLKVFYWITVLFNCLYIVFSDSRTARIAMFVGIGFFMFAFFWEMFHLQTVKRIGAAVVSAVVVVVLLNGAMNLTKQMYRKNIYPYMKEHHLGGGDGYDKVGVTSEELAEEREKDKKTDISNRRFDLWGSGFEVWKTAPLFGTGYVTFGDYALEKVPETYAVNNDYGVFANTHNQYINILVFQGAVGFLILVLFIKKVLKRIFERVFTYEGEDLYYIVTLISVVAIVAVAMLFVLEGIYTNSVGVFLLWFLLGLALQFVDSKERQKK